MIVSCRVNEDFTTGTICALMVRLILSGFIPPAQTTICHDSYAFSEYC